MKKRFLFSLMFLMLGLFLVACTKDPVKHTVAFESNGGSVVASKEVDDNALVARPTDPTKADHSFDGWFKESALTNEWKFAEDKVTGDITLYAKWSKNSDGVEEKVKVTFNLNYPGAPQPTVVEVNKGSKVTAITDPTRAEYKFIGWSTSASENKPFNFGGIVNANSQLYAVWETTLETVVVTFNPDNGEDTHTVNAVVGKVLSAFDNPVKDNHVFLGWFNGEVKWNFETDLVAVEMTLKAKWQELTREGTPISTPEELLEVINGKSEDVYYLIQDIDMTGIVVPYEKDAALLGEFDGQGFAVKNLVRTGAGRLGLFTSIKGGIVKNLVIDGFDINATGDRAGLLTAEIPKGFETVVIENIVIMNSKVHGTASGQSAGSLAAYVDGPVNINGVTVLDVEVNGSNTGTGGLIGHLRDDRVNKDAEGTEISAIIKNIFVDVKVSGTQRVGGVFGSFNAKLRNVELENIVVISELTATGQNVGSIIGKADGTLPSITKVTNVVGISTYSGSSDRNIGNVLGDGNASKFEFNNVYAYVEGLAVDQSNNLGDGIIYNIHEIYNKDWWTTNLKTLTENELWKEDTSGLFVMGDKEFAKPTHKLVTFDFGYDDLTRIVSVKNGGFALPLNLTREGFALLGWKLDGVDFDFGTEITNDITLVASWLDETLLEEFTVTFDSDGGTLIEEQKVIQNENATIPTQPTKEGFEFLGWYLGEVEYNFDDAVTADITLKAKWLDENDVVWFTVTFDTLGGSSIDAVEVREGMTLTIPNIPTKAGFEFGEWQLDGVKFDFGTTITESITLVAVWIEEGASIEISTAQELIDLFTNGGDGNYILVNDLDLSEVAFTGSKATFTGIFDGGDFTISNYNVVSSANKSGALFGKLDGGTIRNLNIEESSIVYLGTSDTLGFIAAYGHGQLVIDNVHFKNVSVNSGGDYASLLFANNDGDSNLTAVKSISNVTVINDLENTVIGKQYNGGLVGHIRRDVNLQLSNIYIDTVVQSINGEAPGQTAGGLIGRVQGDNVNISFESIVSKGKVSGAKDVGLLIGFLEKPATVNVKNVFFSHANLISGNNDVDLVFGRNKDTGSTIVSESVYYDSSTVDILAKGQEKASSQASEVETITQEWLETSGLSTEMFKVVDGKVVLNK